MELHLHAAGHLLYLPHFVLDVSLAVFVCWLRWRARMRWLGFLWICCGIAALFLLAGCAHAPATEPEWNVSNPADKTGWERRSYCRPDGIMRAGPNGLLKVAFPF